ncbi:hypothetical protein HK101_007971 [Irineochytrium annulatum]|nr:hypothetical protein HK101_007971 [Irineochytrium annulatum]
MGSQLEGVGKFRENLECLRATSAMVLDEEQEFTGTEKIAWIPIEWHSILHAMETVDNRMRSISLPILAIVARLLNEQYDVFLTQHPNFRGNVALVGHSLGGIILYDLLANQTSAQSSSASHRSVPQVQTHYEIAYPSLNFTPDFLFTLGSPLSAVLVMRGQDPTTYKPDIPYHNLFHLYDPLAYRTEPLIDERYAEISPVLVQRPSSARTFSMDYYVSLSKLFSSYLPEMPPMPTMPTLQLPELAIFKAVLPNLMQIQLPALPAMPTLPTLPTFNIDSASTFLEGVLSFGKESEANIRRKRSAEGFDDDEEENAQREPPPMRKRRRVDADDNDGDEVIDSSTLGPRATPFKGKEKATDGSPAKEPLGGGFYFASKVSAAIKDIWRNTFTATKIDGSAMSVPCSPANSETVEAAENVLAIRLKAHAEKTLEHTDLGERPLPLQERLDYFVTETVIDSVLHQYLIGMKAHFCYWTQKDIIYHVLQVALPKA